MKKVLLLGAAAALAVLTAMPATAHAETCVTWGPTIYPVPQGICLPV